MQGSKIMEYVSRSFYNSGNKLLMFLVSGITVEDLITTNAIRVYIVATVTFFIVLGVETYQVLGKSCNCKSSGKLRNLKYVH